MGPRSGSSRSPILARTCTRLQESAPVFSAINTCRCLPREVSPLPASHLYARGWLDRWSYTGSLHSNCNSTEGTQGKSTSSSSVLPPLKIGAGVPSTPSTDVWRRLFSVSHVTPQICAAIAHFLQVDLHTSPASDSFSPACDHVNENMPTAHGKSICATLDPLPQDPQKKKGPEWVPC